jgi:hypothetical protein
MSFRPSTIPEFIAWLTEEIDRDADDFYFQEIERDAYYLAVWNEARAWLSERFLPAEVEKRMGPPPREGAALSKVKRLRDRLSRARRAAPKGNPGRPDAYREEVLRYALKLRKDNPGQNSAWLRNRCIEKFSEDDVPINAKAFSSWLYRNSNPV